MESESNLKAFGVGISAVRITEPNEHRKRSSVQVGMFHYLVTTIDIEDAEKTGRERAQQKWPESEGWESHAAAATEITRNDVAQLLEVYLDLAANADFDKAPDVVM